MALDLKKVYSLLGFAAKSKKLSFGKERVRGYIRSDRRKKLVILAEDASSRLKMDIKIRAPEGVKIVEIFSKEELGKLLGRDEISALAVEDDSIIEGILKVLKE